jgi:cytochrome c oxidase subunit 1
MTRTAPRPQTQPEYRAHHALLGSRLVHMLRTTDPKDIAILYLVTAFAFFLAGGLMALLIRAELAAPGLQFLSPEQYNQLFTRADRLTPGRPAWPTTRATPSAWSRRRSRRALR